MVNTNSIQKYLTPSRIEEFVEKNFSHLDIYKAVAHTLKLNPARKLEDTEEVKKAISSVVSKDIFPNLETVISETNIDEETFRLKKYETKAWQSANGRWLHSVQVCYENGLDPDTLNDLRRNLLKDVKKASKPVRRIPPKKHTDLLYLLGIADTHFGKVSTDGENFSAIQRRFEATISYLLDQVAHKKIDRIVFPLGNDLFNIDSSSNTTTRGTPQQTNQSWIQLFNDCKWILINALERCLEVAPVDVITVPGNHDYHSSISMSHVIDAWFHNNQNLTVDLSNRNRKYLLWGLNMLGFSHGDKEKVDVLANLMAVEEAVMWSKSKYRMFFLGHLHKKAERVYQGSNENFGVRVKTLPSLSSTDDWHETNGYVANIKAAEGFLFSKKEGLITTYEKNFL